MESLIFFDIETGPLPADYLAIIKPEFRAAKNLKDLDKIKADIFAKEQEWYQSAALSALTGKVLAIGVAAGNEKPEVLEFDSESRLLMAFWAYIDKRSVCGFNICHLDLPFLFRRAWKLGLRPPLYLRNGRYWSDRVIDLMETWNLGNREDRESLDTISKFLGTGHKTGDGAAFAALWESDRKSAIEYLKNDVSLTRAAFQQMQ